MAGIVRAAAYAPARRLRRETIVAANGWANPGLAAEAKGARAIAAWDEDAITMGVAAARRVANGAAPDSCTLASTTLPFADRLNAGVLAAALDLPDHVGAADAGGSLRAGVTALHRALRTLAGGESALVVAADRRGAKPGSRAELLNGDMAAALWCGTGAVIADWLGGAAVSADFVDHYRGAEADSDYVLEERWVRDEAVVKLAPIAVQRVLGPHGLTPAEVEIVAYAFPTPALAKAAAKACGLPAPDGAVEGALGHGGAAHPLIALTHALERARPHDHILLLAFGQGVEALLFKATEGVVTLRPTVAPAIAGGRDEPSYTRFLSQSGRLDYDFGIRAEHDRRTAQTVAWRRGRELTAFVGGKCGRCGTVQFPRARACVNPNCRAFDTQEPWRLADCAGTIASFTEDWQAFTPDPPLRYGNVRLEGGGNVLMELCDVGDAALAVGTRLRMEFRVKDLDPRRDFRRYFWKAAPVGEAG